MALCVELRGHGGVQGTRIPHYRLKGDCFKPFGALLERSDDFRRNGLKKWSLRVFIGGHKVTTNPDGKGRSKYLRTRVN